MPLTATAATQAKPEDKPYKFVTVRHTPVTPDTYAGWGYTGGLPNFDALPTWKYATPHNLARWTTRTQVADGQPCFQACHATPATLDGFFLRQIDLNENPLEAAANQHLIVPDTLPTEW